MRENGIPLAGETRYSPPMLEASQTRVQSEMLRRTERWRLRFAVVPSRSLRPMLESGRTRSLEGQSPLPIGPPSNGCFEPSGSNESVRKNSRKTTGFQSIAVQWNLPLSDLGWKCCIHCGGHGLWPVAGPLIYSSAARLGIIRIYTLPSFERINSNCDDISQTGSGKRQ